MRIRNTVAPIHFGGLIPVRGGKKWTGRTIFPFGPGISVSCFGFEVWGFRFKVLGFSLRVQDLGFGIQH